MEVVHSKRAVDINYEDAVKEAMNFTDPATALLTRTRRNKVILMVTN